MRREERLQRILEVLDDESFVTVESLSRTFFISLPTVYRDLRELADQRLIIRGNGGAMRISEEKTSMPLNFRKSIQAEEKASIARRALELLQPHSTIFIDASSTAANLIDYLEPAMDLTVLTNGILAAMCLCNAGIRTCCIGGYLSGSSMAVGGKIAHDTLEHFQIDTLFFSSYGIEPQGTIVDPSEPESLLRRQLLQKPITSVFLCDSSKFDKHSVFRVASLDRIDYVVTDVPLPPAYPLPRQGVLLA